MPPYHLHGLLPAHIPGASKGPVHELVPCDGLTALISDAPDTENFADPEPDKLAGWVLTHNAILTIYCADYPVLPMALGTVFSSKNAIIEKLRDDYQTYLTALAKLEHLREYTVQLTQITADSPAKQITTTSGRAFLTDRRAARDRRKNQNVDQQRLAQDILDELHANAVQVTGRTSVKPERRLDCAMLWHKDQISRLRLLAKQRHHDALALGLDLVIAGPWPPYSFEMSSPEIAAAG